MNKDYHCYYYYIHSRVQTLSFDGVSSLKSVVLGLSRPDVSKLSSESCNKSRVEVSRDRPV